MPLQNQSNLIILIKYFIKTNRRPNTQYSFQEKDSIDFTVTHDHDYLNVDFLEILLRKIGQEP